MHRTRLSGRSMTVPRLGACINRYNYTKRFLHNAQNMSTYDRVNRLTNQQGIQHYRSFCSTVNNDITIESKSILSQLDRWLPGIIFKNDARGFGSFKRSSNKNTSNTNNKSSSTSTSTSQPKKKETANNDNNNSNNNNSNSDKNNNPKPKKSQKIVKMKHKKQKKTKKK